MTERVTRTEIHRREFIAMLGGAAAAWPLAARAQQAAMPVVGFLSSGSQQSDAWRLAAFRRGLNEAGYIEGRNVVSEFLWADDQYDRLPALAAELVQRQPAVIIAVGGPAPALAAKAASTTIPIVFAIAGEPVKLGLVASVNRPGGNATGVSTLFSSVVAKQLEILREVVPKAMVIGCLVNPGNPNAATGTREAHEAARALGLDLRFVNASTEREIDMAFQALVQDRVDALVVVTDPLFNSRPNQLSTLAARHALPAIYPYREFATAGGLISYGGTLTEPWYLAGGYAGRILKGERAADLPVPAFDAATREHADALVVGIDAIMQANSKHITDLAAKRRLPAIYASREFIETGGLLAYGVSYPDLYRRAAIYVDKILKGAKPADLPVEQPTKFELVINLNTARALGLEVPPTLIVRADQVIE